MTRILLIRHAEPSAPWHVEHDPGLSELGFRQAEAAAEALEATRGIRVVTSPLKRCQETAAPFAARVGAAPFVEPRVTEVPSPAVTDRQVWLRETFPGALDGGEPRGWAACGVGVLRWRDGVVAALGELTEDTAVFTHFVAINAAVSAALARDQAIVCRPAHASITELACENGVLRLVSLGAQVGGGKVA
ncbi:MAG: histidine phosphatase family protein [Pseudomonadota bacterium]